MSTPHEQATPAAVAVRNIQAVEFAWRAHSSQEAWTAKVDAKASIVLALDGGLLVAVIAGHTTGGPLTLMQGWRNVAQALGAGLLLVALAFAAAAVIPMLGRSSDHRRHYRTNTIYFGHVRHWPPADLAGRLRDQTLEEQTDLLAAQLTQMSSRNWWKHRLVQASVLAVPPAAVLISAAALYPR